MRRDERLRRFFEIVPGACTWATILGLVALSVIRPLWVAIFIIVFDLYWVIRVGYFTTLLVFAYRRLEVEKKINWIKRCDELEAIDGLRCSNIYQAVVFPVYKEGPEVLVSSIQALINSNYDKKKMIVELTIEERGQEAVWESAKELQKRFRNNFYEFIITRHPDGIKGEAKTKGANATWGAKVLKEFLDSKKIDYKHVIISCFDADTCAEKEYFGCLAYHYITNPKRMQSSYQPIPVYNNNIWHARSIARVIELGSSFMQMIETMRLDKFVTFSSHSMSFKTLVDVDYWPVDMISDDSVVYWKAFLHYDGEYRVVPLYTIVSMDVAYSKNIFKTIWLQYRQKRRWAWGVENFPFLMKGFVKNPRIPIMTKIRRVYNLLESHITWAVWAVILMVIAPLPILLGGTHFTQIPIGYNLPRITGMLLNFTLIASFVIIILSMLLLPPRPKDVKRTKYLVMILEWIIVPFIILILGSTPALDAQTRLMLGKYMEFQATEKTRFKKK